MNNSIIDKADNSSLVWIDALRMPLIIAVVLVHAYDPVRATTGNLVSLQQQSEVADFVTFILSQVLCRLAVPVFFLVSGYFFIKCGINQVGIFDYKNAVKKRMYTIGLPYLIWNTILLITLYLLLLTGLYVPDIDSKYYAITSRSSFFDIIIKVYGIGTYPLVYQFWFLRDLLFACLIGGFILLFGKRVVLLSISTLFIIWIAGIGANLHPQPTALLFFLLGVYLREFNALDIWAPRISPYLTITYAALAISEYFFRESMAYPYYHRFVLVIGVLSAYQLVRVLTFGKPSVSIWLKLAPASFFVYAFHEPLLTLVKKQFFSFVESGAPALLIYFSSAAIAIVASLLTYLVLKKVLPTPLSYLIGGRV